MEAVKAPADPSKSQQQSAASALSSSIKEVVTSWRTWLLALTYFFVYLVRQGCTSWLIFYLLEAKGAVDTAAAAVTVSGMIDGRPLSVGYVSVGYAKEQLMALESACDQPDSCSRACDEWLQQLK